MTPTNKSPELAGTSGRSLEDSTHADDTRTLRKWERVLSALLAGRSFNRFEAERELHDHCLHTTVAGLQARGVTILRHDEVVPGFMGCATNVMRYTLDRTPDNIARVRALLANTAPRRNDQAKEVAEKHHPALADAAEGTI